MRTKYIMNRLFNSAVGVLIELYRKSPFWPTFGRIFARLLSKFFQPKERYVVKRIGSISYNLDLAEVIDSSLYFTGSFESKIEAFVNATVTQGMTVIDIGANTGYHTLHFAHLVGPTGIVIAIEPTTWAKNRLLANIDLNNFSQVIVEAIALSDRDIGLCKCAFQSSYPLSGELHLIEESIPMLRLDTVLEKFNLRSIDLIKIDVDGAEMQVMNGALATIKKHRPIIILEVTPPSDNLKIPVLELLENLGYQFKDEDGELVENSAQYLRYLQGSLPVNLTCSLKVGSVDNSGLSI